MLLNENSSQICWPHITQCDLFQYYFLYFIFRSSIFVYFWLFYQQKAKLAKLGWIGLAGYHGYLKRIAELDNFTMFHYYSIRMILIPKKEFIQSEGVVCKKEYWDLKVKLLPLCLHSVGIPKIRLVKPKLYIPSTLNIDLILWHTQLIVCAVKC